MVYINLLPIRAIKKRHQAIRQLSLAVMVVVAILVVLGGVGFYQSSKAAQLKADIAALNKEKQHYNQILAQIKKLEADKLLIENKIAVIKQLQKSSALTVHILDEVANIIPNKRIWLNTLSQSGGTLNLTGMALDNQTIAQFMEDLKASDFISEVNLSNTSLSNYAGRSLKSFSLSCTVSMPEIEKKTTLENQL
jgi:type IV pilus assembly protein PilN